MSVTRRSPHGERGLKSRHLLTISATRGRSPHGERGLKYASAIPKRHVTMSLSSWRAWIEMNCSLKPATNCLGRSPHGERGLKSNAVIYLGAYLGRSPHGERGLKLPVALPACLRIVGRSPHGERGLKWLGSRDGIRA